jgi:hypothetical protein
MEADVGLRDVANWLCDWNAKPDFKQIVEKSLALFGVFTGVTLSFYIKDFLFGDKIPDGFKDFSVPSRVLISASVIALLLRYIVGSAVHLNATYVAKVTTTIERNPNGADVLVETKEPKSESLGWLFFDIIMLVGFGILAVYIIYSIDLKEFLARSVDFILVGLAWSVIALIWRPGDRAVAERWCCIDGVQLIITLVLYVTSWSDLCKTSILAIVYISCLFLDFCVISRPSPTPAVPAP